MNERELEALEYVVKMVFEDYKEVLIESARKGEQALSAENVELGFKMLTRVLEELGGLDMQGLLSAAKKVVLELSAEELSTLELALKDFRDQVRDVMDLSEEMRAFSLAKLEPVIVKVGAAREQLRIR